MIRAGSAREAPVRNRNSESRNVSRRPLATPAPSNSDKAPRRRAGSEFIEIFLSEFGPACGWIAHRAGSRSRLEDQQFRDTAARARA